MGWHTKQVGDGTMQIVNDDATIALEIETNGKVDLQQGLKIGSTDISTTELGYLDGQTAGTVTASKAVIVDASKDIGDFRNLDAVNIDAGASGTAGTVDVFPSTAAKGKLALTCADQTGDTTVTLNAEAMGQATNIGIPDPGGADADVVLTAGSQTVAGVKTFSSALRNSANVGAAGTGVTAVEYGDGLNHTTVLTLTGVAATIGDNVALAGGALIYTLPAGAAVINSSTLSAGITLTTGTPTTDTPELALGTTVASGANATLGAVAATAENISVAPVVLADVAGTAGVVTGAPGIAIEAAGAHTVYINYADLWADVTDTAATINGTVVLNWSLLPIA